MNTIVLIVVIPLLVSIAANFMSEPLKRRILGFALSLSSVFRGYWRYSDDTAETLSQSTVKCVSYFAGMLLYLTISSMMTVITFSLFLTMRIIRDTNDSVFSDLKSVYYIFALLCIIMAVFTTLYAYHSIAIARKIYRAR